ncbi:MAG: hypothetical protein K9H64_18400 [Bacteroidales bacterium]|nr:hypothetical protein [Bacteroidales bacterium]MCF8458025.1 hypothetical protein [Bacteroidales bacterium]
MKYLIGIDDTDNKDSRGTGFRARHMASMIEENSLGKVLGITRHQLFVHPSIAYTSQNSSACIEVESNQAENLRLFCRQFLLDDSAPGSDAGMSFCEEERIPDEIMEWGNKAKCEVLQMEDAFSLSSKYNIYLEGLTGEKIGVIGALAAIGLRKGENDGRFIWLQGNQLRAVNGIQTLQELKEKIGLTAALTQNGVSVADGARIQLHDWVRPVLQNKQILIYVDKAENYENYDWKMASKEYHQSISN